MDEAKSSVTKERMCLRARSYNTRGVRLNESASRLERKPLIAKQGTIHSSGQHWGWQFWQSHSHFWCTWISRLPLEHKGLW